ncbi:UNVERIFIED_CONTAM: GDT1-like protein 3 [Sesamum radiatum]|uniref:GDT1-like protein 3 n=1 Tax=Sesamum radiatum TaxID=300843 RepID=A0AAW2TFC5_SESRA
MDPLRGKPFYLYVFLVVFLLLSFSVPQISAQESEERESSAAIKSLGRRSKIFGDKIKTGIAKEEKDLDLVDLGVNLDSGLGVFDAFFASLSMILVSEQLMAMRHPKSIVLSGALSALFVMTILSTGLGRIVPNLISRKHTNNAATGSCLNSMT